MPTFAEYLEKWLKQSTAQGLTNPLVKMPVKRFHLLQPDGFKTLANGGTLTLGTTSDPVARNLEKNYRQRIRDRGEHSAFICSGAVEMIVVAGPDGKERKQLFPVCLKRASLKTSGANIKAVVADDEPWLFNPVLQAHLRGMAIQVPLGCRPRSTCPKPGASHQLGQSPTRESSIASNVRLLCGAV